MMNDRLPFINISREEAGEMVVDSSEKAQSQSLVTGCAKVFQHFPKLALRQPRLQEGEVVG